MEEPHDIIIFFGRFHPLVVHLPIGFLIIAIAFEWLSRGNRITVSDHTMRLIWILGGVSAALAATLGYLLSLGGDYNEETLSWHMWSGIVLTIVSFICVFARSLVRIKWLYLSFTLVAGILLTVTGHYGGSLTHGSEYLIEHAPGPVRTLAGYSVESYERRPPVTSLDSADIFLDAIMPIMRSKCTSCHNQDKKKGKLLLTSYDAMLLGGEVGPAIVPGSLDSSEVYNRITLPSDHEDFMPAEGKRPLTDEQVAIIGWWIVKQAPRKASVASLSPDEETTELFNRFFGLGTRSLDLIAAPSADETVISKLEQGKFIVHKLSAKSNLLDVVLPEGTTSKPDLSSLPVIKEQLVWLQLAHGKLSDADLEIVGQLVNLRKLNLSRNDITDQGLQKLLSLNNLEYLNLYSTQVSDKGVRNLLKLPSLRSLYVWQTKVTAPLMDSINRTSKQLKIIYLDPSE